MRRGSLPRARRTSSAGSGPTSPCASTCACRQASTPVSSSGLSTSRRTGRGGRSTPRRAEGQLRFGIAQGGTDADLRARSITEITALPFDGYALGGLAVGESKKEMLDCVEWAAPLLPKTRPRYFMGIGDPEGILEVVARGIDMFDCVLPTRTARTGSALTWRGPDQPPERRLPDRSAPARRGLRLPRLRAVLACIHPAPRDATRNSRIAAVEPA